MKLRINASMPKNLLAELAPNQLGRWIEKLQNGATLLGFNLKRSPAKNWTLSKDGVYIGTLRIDAVGGGASLTFDRGTPEEVKKTLIPLFNAQDFNTSGLEWTVKF